MGARSELDSLSGGKLMAVISRQLRLVFLHVSKTAGTSIASVLQPWSDLEIPHERMHLTLDECLEFLCEAEVETFRKVMVVRNSWDRIASAYWHHLRSPDLEPDVYRGIMSSGLSGFIRRHARSVWGSQTRWLFYRGGKAQVEILHFERLEDDFAAFCRSLGVAVKLPRLNVTEGRPPAEHIFTASVRDLVAEIFADEIREFGFEPPPAVSAAEFYAPSERALFDGETRPGALR